jgi:hypothetical protein
MLDELERLERAATPGRHTTGEAEHDAIPYVGIGYTDEVYALDSADPHEPVATFERPEDAALYAAARNALPALLAVARAAREARRLAARLDELAAVLEADINDVETQTAYELLGSDEIMALSDLDAALAALEGAPDA